MVPPHRDVDADQGRWGVVVGVVVVIVVVVVLIVFDYPVYN